MEQRDIPLTFQGLTLGKVTVVVVCKDTRPIAPYDTLQEAIVNLFINSIRRFNF